MKLLSRGAAYGRLVGLLAGVVFGGLLLSMGVTQEVPIGQVQGKIVMGENQLPLEDVLVTFTPMSATDEDIIRPRYAYSDKDGLFDIRNVPAGAYEMEVSASHHRADMRYVWIYEGKAQDLGTLELKPDEPYLHLYSSQRVFTPDEKPLAELHGFTPSKDVKVDVYRLNLDSLAREGGLENALYPLAQQKVMPKDQGMLISSTQQQITKRDAEGAFIEKLTLPSLAAGFYFIKTSAGDIKAATYLNITRIAMVTKYANRKTLAYVTDIVTGEPIEGATVDAKRGNHLQYAGKSTADGTLNLTSANDENAALVARKGPSSAIVGFGIGDSNESPIDIVTYTERPVYRPGDRIYFKSVVRREDADQYVLPGTGTATVTLKDPDGNVSQKKELRVSAHGTVDGFFDTVSEADPGYWSLKVEALGGENQYDFPLQAYRKPEYTINVTPTKPYFVLGGKASAKVHCEYYFGGPVIGAKVSASVYRSPVYSYEGMDEEDEQDYESDGGFVGGEYSQEIEAVTDANGDALIEFDTKAKDDPDEYPTDFTYTVQASVADTGDKYFDGQGDISVVRGDFDLNADTNEYVVKPGDKVEVTATAAQHGKGAPIVGKPITFVVGSQEWTRRTSFFVPLGQYDAVTDANGIARIQIPIDKSGSISIKATAEDASGNKIVSEADLWVSGEGEGWNPDMGDLKLTLDKKVYDPGDTAKALIQTKYVGGSALVTVEASEVMWQKVVSLKDNSTVVELPIEARYAPDAFVSIEYVNKKKYFSDSKRFKEQRKDRELNVSVTSSQPTYKPGDNAQVQIETKDSDGNPVPADVSLAVVDESIYAIREDKTNLNRDLYPSRYDQVQTAFSFPEVYLDGGDKAPLSIALRTKFKDTAFWVPSVQTDDKGMATVRFQLPDNLTQWRATAVGITDQSVAGLGTADFRARKDLMVRLQPPMYLVQFDTQRMAVIVTNDTGKDQDVHVQVDAGGLDLKGTPKQTIRVPNGTPQTVEFDLNAPDAGTAVLTARVWIDGGASDGVRQSLTIAPHARDEITARAGEARPRNTESFTLLGDATSAQLKVNVSASLAGGLVQTLPDLVDFPYGCVEQTMSRFMPAVIVSKTLKDLGIPMPATQKKIAKVAAESYARLAKMQHSGGDWGWWEYDDPNPFMTALVLDGLDRARTAGYPIRDVDLKKAIEAARSLAQKRPTDKWELESWDRDRLYLAYVLARFGDRDVSTRILKSWNIDRGGASEAALAALTANALGDQTTSNVALSRLVALAQVGKLTGSWPSQQYSWGNEPTSLALAAFIAIRPDDPMVEKTVRFLMAARKGDMWNSTRDSSYALIGLTGFLARHKEDLSNAADVTVSINGQPVRTVHVDSQNLEAASESIDIPKDKLQVGENRLEVSATSGFGCYYSAQLDQWVTHADLPEQPSEGLSIKRQYFKMGPKRARDGTLRLLPSDEPVTSAQSGDIIRVVLSITSSQERQFMMVEDPVPSNCRITERTDEDSVDQWAWWYSKSVIRDDRIAFFTTWLAPGTHTISYSMRAESPGTCGALPTTIANMYDPSQRASGASSKLEISK